MASDTDTVRALKGLGIVMAGYTAGCIFSFSHVALPTVQLAPRTLMLKQWAEVFNRGIRTGPPSSLTSTLAFGYVAYAQPEMRKMFAVSAMLPLMIFPFTSLFMVSINNKLHPRVAAAEKLKEGEELNEAKEEESASELVHQWRARNYVRSLFPLAGALLGAYSTLFF